MGSQLFLWVAIITGAGDKAFSAGNDLRFQAEGGKMEVPETGFAGLTARYNITKPVIAAVNGVAMGGWFEIALEEGSQHLEFQILPQLLHQQVYGLQHLLQSF